MIYTNEDAFTVSGDITSLYGNVGLKINGNQLLYPAGDLNVLAEPTRQAENSYAVFCLKKKK